MVRFTLSKHNYLLIEYGKKNEAQSYGGNTTLIYCKSGITKPCIAPVYFNNGVLLGILYFMFNQYTNTFYTYIVSNPSNSTYLIRLIGIGGV